MMVPNHCDTHESVSPVKIVVSLLLFKRAVLLVSSLLFGWQSFQSEKRMAILPECFHQVVTAIPKQSAPCD